MKTDVRTGIQTVVRTDIRTKMRTVLRVYMRSNEIPSEKGKGKTLAKGLIYTED